MTVSPPASPRVRVAPDVAALAALAADEVARRAEEAVRARGRFDLALAGGTTPERLYRLLADPSAPYRRRVPWDRTEVFFGDERCVPPDAAASNFRMASEALLAHVPIAPGSVHRIRGELDPEAAARACEEELRAAAGGAFPALDLVLLGLGADGHTASLFPGSPALDERARAAVAVVAPATPPRRVTLTLPVLEAARAVAFLVAGASKASRVAEVLEGRAPGLPAARVHPAAGELLWLLDAEAARELQELR